MKEQLAPLTGLRGVAAYSVLFAHVIAVLDIGLVGFSSCLAYMGMTLFFVLSGFVLFYGYGASVGEEKGAIRSFAIARFARLYPLYVVVVFVSLAIAPGPWPTLGPWVTLSYLTLTQTWFNVQMAVFPPAWSISAEWFFYFAFVPLVPLVRGMRRPVSALAVYCVVILVGLLLLFGTMAHQTAGVIDRWWNFGSASAGGMGWAIYFAPPLRLLDFIAGMLAAKAYITLSKSDPRPLALTSVAALSIGAVIAVLAAGAIVPVEESLFYFVRCNFLMAPPLAALMLVVCLAPKTLARALSSRPFMMAGEISYSVYLWQFVVMSALASYFPQGSNKALYGATIIGGSTMVAYVSYRVIEQPSRMWLRRWLLSTKSKQLAIPPR